MGVAGERQWRDGENAGGRHSRLDAGIQTPRMAIIRLADATFKSPAAPHPPLRQQPESRVFNCRREAPSHPRSPRRHARSPLSGRPASLLSSIPRRPNIKTLDSVSVRNSGATLPYSSTARNDGPRHLPALAGGSTVTAARAYSRRYRYLKTLDSGCRRSGD